MGSHSTFKTFDLSLEGLVFLLSIKFHSLSMNKWLLIN